MRRADQYATELSHASNDMFTEERESAETYPLDPECSHRPTKRKQKPHPKTKQTKKPRISSHLHDREIEQLSSSSSDEALPYHHNRNPSEMQGIEDNAAKHSKHHFREQRA